MGWRQLRVLCFDDDMMALARKRKLEKKEESRKCKRFFIVGRNQVRMISYVLKGVWRPLF
jgi:hypothetical protein